MVQMKYLNTLNLTLGLDNKCINLIKKDSVAADMIKEFRLPSGKRIDFLDIKNGRIYELKPFNPQAIKLGQKQLRNYKRELETIPKFKGIEWNTILETY